MSRLAWRGHETFAEYRARVAWWERVLDSEWLIPVAAFLTAGCAAFAFRYVGWL